MLVLFLSVVLQSLGQHASGPRGTVEWEGYVERVTPLPDGTGVTITLRASDVGARLRAPSQTLVRFPGIPQSYSAALAGTPRLLLSGSIQGRVARIHAYIDDRGINVAAVETRQPDGVQTNRLDYVRPYFDLTADRRAIHECSLAAVVLSQHPENVRQGTTIWVRDVIKHTLFFYERTTQAREMIRRFGDATMNDDISTIQRVRREHGDRIGLIRLQPFVPKVPGDRFVGWWGGFPVEIYMDAGSGPTLAFSRDPRQRPSQP
jgi:hypothetical protein